MILPSRRLAALGAVLLLALPAVCLAPTALAACGIDPNPDGDVDVYASCSGACGIRAQHADHSCSDPVPESWVPCLVLNLTIERPSSTGGEPVNVNRSAGICDDSSADVRFRWSAGPLGGKGNATFALQVPGDTVEEVPRCEHYLSGPCRILDDPPNSTILSAESADARPRAVSPLTALLEDLVTLPAARTAASAAPLPRVVVTVAFDVAWGGDCGGAHGTLSARVNDAAASAEAPPAFFRDLCALSKAPDDPRLVPSAAGALAALAGAVASGVPAPAFGTLVEGLFSLLPAIPAAPQAAPPTLAGPPVVDPPATEIPNPPAPDDEGRAAGDATLTLFDAEDIVAERHDAIFATPVGGGDVHGGAGLAYPAISGAWSAPIAGSAPQGPPPPSSAPLARATAPPEPPGRAPPGDPAATGDAARGSAPPLLAASLPEGATSDGIGVARATAVAAAAGALALFAAFALYQRNSRPAALRHEGRAALLRACQEMGRPATVGELAAATGMAWKTAEYHVRYLARLGHLRMDESHEGPKRFALHSTPRPLAPPAAPLDDRVLDRIRGSPGASASEIARELDVPRPRIDRRVKDLLTQGLVESRVERGSRRLYPA